ncbi:hypothetical protein J6Q66_09635 [bacterium]|nr:hypothetical protein [bacterium]
MDKQYLSVSEFAALKGISKQAVYQQLNKNLKEFVKLENGKKVISIKALSESDLKRLEQPLEQEFKQVEQPLEQDFFILQIAEKDKQIESLLKQIDSLQEQNSKLTDLLHNSQVLLAAEKKTLFIDSAEKQGKKGFFNKIFRSGKNA